MAIAAPLIPPAVEGLATAGGWVLGGITTLFAAKTIVDKTTETAQTKTKEKDCSNNEHRGRVQAQEGGVMLVPGAPWDQCDPPSVAQVVGLANQVQAGVGALGNQYIKGSAVALTALTAWCQKRPPAGVSVSKWSFYFDGSRSLGADRTKSGANSRRLDIDVLKGEALKF